MQTDKENNQEGSIDTSGVKDCIKVVSIKLNLDQARWLKGLFQNKLYDDEETEFQRETRKVIWDQLHEQIPFGG